MTDVQAKLTDWLRNVYQYGSASKVAYVSPQVHDEIREAFGDDYSEGVLSIAQFRLKVFERASCPPGTAFVLDAP